jgi:hypothetical protein
MSRWFRHYAGMMRDDKLVRVAIRSKQTIERVVWVYAAILESAAEIDDAGRYDLDAAEAAYFLRADEDDVVGIMRELQVAGRIAEGCVVKWGDRQFQSDRSAERVARHRAKKRQDNVGDGRGNGAVTLQEQPRNSPETETELEKESSEANASSQRAWACPPGVHPDHWRDFRANRKTRRLTNSPTAYAGQLKALSELADDEWPPGRLVQYAAEKGWGSINKPDEGSFNGQANRGSSQRMGGPRPDPTLELLRAARAAQRSDGRDYEQPRSALPAG